MSLNFTNDVTSLWFREGPRPAFSINGVTSGNLLDLSLTRLLKGTTPWTVHTQPTREAFNFLTSHRGITLTFVFSVQPSLRVRVVSDGEANRMGGW
jgi:hypothetical protein